MPKVHRVKRTRGGQKTYLCVKCHEAIVAGQEYYHWTPYKSNTRQQHVSCGYPSQSQLRPGSKMARVDDAVQDADLGSLTSGDEIETALGQVADIAREVAEEYGESADNIESNFPSGNPTSEACRAAQEGLESWAEDLDSWTADEKEDDEDEDDYLERVREEAQDALGEQPQYEG